MELSINLQDYLDEGRIAEIVEEEFRNSLRGIFSVYNNVADFLSHISYDMVLRLAWEQFNMSSEEFHEAIKKRIVEILDNPDAIRFEVFRKKDILNASDSPAVKYLNEVLLESKPKIEAAINAIIDKYPFNELKDEIEDTIYDCIMRKFRGNRDDTKGGEV